MAVPMFNEHPIEMGMKGREQEIAARLAGRSVAWRRGSARRFLGCPAVSIAHAVKAIATFERTLLSADSPSIAICIGTIARAHVAGGAARKAICSSRTVSAAASVTRASTCRARSPSSGPRPCARLSQHRAVQRGRPRQLSRRRSRAGRFGRRSPRTWDASERRRCETLRSRRPTCTMGASRRSERRSPITRSGGVASPYKSDRLNGFTLTPAQTADLIAFLESLTDKNFSRQPRVCPTRSLP